MNSPVSALTRACLVSHATARTLGLFYSNEGGQLRKASACSANAADHRPTTPTRLSATRQGRSAELSKLILVKLLKQDWNFFLRSNYSVPDHALPLGGQGSQVCTKANPDSAGGKERGAP